MSSLPPEVDSPNLTPEERQGLVIAHEGFVVTGAAEWETDDE